MELWFILGFLAVAGLSVIVYFSLMVFFPEWVGITGKIARDAELSHQEGASEETGNTPFKG